MNHILNKGLYTFGVQRFVPIVPWALADGEEPACDGLPPRSSMVSSLMCQISNCKYSK
jgi:hypothetical protein